MLIGTDLRKASRMCEVAGIEVHYPMLDPRVIGLSLESPDDLKFRGQNFQHLFEQAMTGGALEKRSIFNPYFLREIVSLQQVGHALCYGCAIRNLAMFECWMQAHTRSIQARRRQPTKE